MTKADDQRQGFFEFLFGDQEGYLCIATRNVTTGAFEESYYSFPEDLLQALKDINQWLPTNDVYFCAQLLDVPKRKKEHVSEAAAAWADLDLCAPENLLVAPTIVMETSEDKYQALWKFTERIPASDGEDVSKRIAYYHVSDGADKSGWDLTQLLRVPLTFNHKYKENRGSQKVEVIMARPENKYNPDDFREYPEAEGEGTVPDIPMPESLPMKSTEGRAEQILEEYKLDLNPKVWDLVATTPTADWSAKLWELELTLFESGLDKEEVYTVAKHSACNKYARDNKPSSFLWKDVCRAWKHVEDRNSPFPVDVDRSHTMKPLLDDEDKKSVEKDPSIVEEYVEWAKTLGDAAWQYHQAGAFVALSTLLAGDVKLPTSFGVVAPNLWFMILADTTLTRKTTAMDLAIDLLREVDPDCILATDGSIEGLLTALSTRPSRPSVFLRDEFTGLMELMGKRDYYAGMMEALTKMYDGKYQKRVLRKETIEVKDPILILFAGGIKSRMLELMSHEHVGSGFVPRFVFITAESDITKVKPLGPPTRATVDRRTELMRRLSEIKDHYAAKSAVKKDETTGRIHLPRTWDASLTDDAWVLYNRFETNMVEDALHGTMKETMTPTMARLAISGLKAAVLIAASKRLEEKVVVTEADLFHAFYYVEQWREYTMEILAGVGKSPRENNIDRIYRTIESNPGILRSTLMQNYHLSAKEADAIFSTLHQRGLIHRQKSGRSERLHPVKR